MRIGIDFDNTIVCYDALFHRVCVEQGLIPATVPANKSSVRNYLREIGRENDWTQIQGYIYGPRMREAAAFPGVLEFLAACKTKSTECFIISHKTRHPYRGASYDLHQSAMDWLNETGFLQTDRTGLEAAKVFFEPAKTDKVNRIAACGCTHFIDDLPEFLAELEGLRHLRKFLFDPNGLYPAGGDFQKFADWTEAIPLFL
jgi:hypothetical protein